MHDHISSNTQSLTQKYKKNLKTPKPRFKMHECMKKGED